MSYEKRRSCKWSCSLQPEQLIIWDEYFRRRDTMSFRSCRISVNELASLIRTHQRQIHPAGKLISPGDRLPSRS